VSPSMLRIAAGVIAFAIVALGGALLLNFAGEESALVSAWTWVTVAAVAAGIATYGAVEYAQTKRFDSITRQFDTRTLVLMPVAIGLNIILGQAVGAALKVPVYLDSIGTILVGALAGPLPGALTGLLSNTVWTFVLPPPFHSDNAAAWAVVAAVIGLMAGAFGRFGWLRPRPTSDSGRLALAAVISVGLVLGLAWLAYLGWLAIGEEIDLAPTGDATFVILAGLALAIVIGTVIGMVVTLFVKRDLTAAYVVVAGVATGIVAAILSAPISANLFSGVTGAGTDFLVAAFRQAGADIQSATLGQGFISDPIDKVITFSVVYVLLGALAARTKARFPQGEQLLETSDAAPPPPPPPRPEPER
jgi:hypothetical protein